MVQYYCSTASSISAFMPDYHTTLQHPTKQLTTTALLLFFIRNEMLRKQCRKQDDNKKPSVRFTGVYELQEPFYILELVCNTPSEL